MRARLFFVILATAILSACAISPIDESDEIAEMWAFARANKTWEREDSREVWYVTDPDATCTNLGMVPHYWLPPLVAGQNNNAGAVRARARGCTILTDKPYSILALDPTAGEIAHEAAHRVYGNWHKGYIYIGSREWVLFSARGRPWGFW